MELAAGDYVRYRTGNGKEAEGYIIDITSFCDQNTAWIGKRPNELSQKMDFVSFEDITEKVPPPVGVRIQRDVTNP